ncbi:MAG: ABC transporter permease [Nocardioides sp.]|uniref:ABC transporter permease n=1 Tax=Nocardioides sp. TaxID=35761 RepID=UPI0039E5BFA5
MILAAAVALYVWAQGQDLDEIEQRTLNRDFIVTSLEQHIKLVIVATAVVAVTAIPIGTLLTRGRLRAFAPAVVAFANAGQAVPTLGVIVLLSFWIGIGFEVAVVGLAIYAFLPALRNTIVGFSQVDPSILEAAHGMGMSGFRTLTRVEFPLALPIIIAGLRITIVLNVANATIATFVNAGGMGALIVNGIQLQRTPVLIVGGVTVALLAVSFDWLAGRAEALAAHMAWG